MRDKMRQMLSDVVLRALDHGRVENIHTVIEQENDTILKAILAHLANELSDSPEQEKEMIKKLHPIIWG